MRTKVQLYKPQEGSNMPEMPKSILAATDIILYQTTTFMRMFGVSRITVSPVNMGMKTLTDIDFKTLEGKPPIEYVAARNTALRNIAEMMSIFGVLDVEILPNEKEMGIIEESWRAFEAGDVVEVKLNLDTDPTGASVLPEKK
jgi:hypothetical protein